MICFSYKDKKHKAPHAHFTGLLHACLQHAKWKNVHVNTGQKLLKHMNKNNCTDCHPRGKTLQKTCRGRNSHTQRWQKLLYPTWLSCFSVFLRVCCWCKKYIGHAVVCQYVHHPSSSTYQGSQKYQAKFWEMCTTQLEYDEAIKRLHVLGFNISLW